MTDIREKLIKLLLKTVGCDRLRAGEISDRLIANGVTVQQWIPVTERLPEPYVSVLTLRQKFDDGRCFKRVEHIIPVYGGDFAWFMDMSGWKSKVTHWMPLPEPPKEG